MDLTLVHHRHLKTIRRLEKENNVFKVKIKKLENLLKKEKELREATVKNYEARLYALANGPY